MSLRTPELAMLMARYGSDTVAGDLARDLVVTRGLAMALLTFLEGTENRAIIEATLDQLVSDARVRMYQLQCARPEMVH